METTLTATTTVQSIYPAVRYNDAPAAIAWLTSLGFEEHLVCAGDAGRIDHAELKFAGNLFMLGSFKDDQSGQSPADLGGTVGIYIGLETAQDIDRLFARAKAAGANIIRPLTDTEYGSHEFGLRDPEGHHWSFGTYRPQATDRPNA